MSREEVKARRRRIMVALDTLARRQPHSTPEEGAKLLLMVLAAWGDEPTELDEEGGDTGRSPRSGFGDFGEADEYQMRAGHPVRHQ